MRIHLVTFLPGSFYLAEGSNVINFFYANLVLAMCVKIYSGPSQKHSIEIVKRTFHWSAHASLFWTTIPRRFIRFMNAAAFVSMFYADTDNPDIKPWSLPPQIRRNHISQNIPRFFWSTFKPGNIRPVDRIAHVMRIGNFSLPLSTFRYKFNYLILPPIPILPELIITAILQECSQPKPFCIV